MIFKQGETNAMSDEQMQGTDYISEKLERLYPCKTLPLQFSICRSEIKDCNGQVVEVVE